MPMQIEPIRYFSTNAGIFGTPDLEGRISSGDLPTVGLAEAIILGQADDGGLFMPIRFPKIEPRDIGRMRGMSYSQIFARVMGDFFYGVLTEATLKKIANDAYTFQPYIEQISDADILVRLDEGPTAAFKDYAAQVLFRIVEALRKEVPETEVEFRYELKNIPLMSFIVATSGDTGGAMGAACYRREKMWMTILHSSNIPEHVSELQAKQMDTLGSNVYVIRVNTDFDGCASLASRLISDPELKYINPNSANSVNIGRLLPQIAYYFFAYSRIPDQNEQVAVSVPSGNFGNAVAGFFARRIGLPIKLIIGVNENDVFERFYRTGKYEPAESTHPSPSNSMNVNKPSNMRRLFQLYGGQLVDGRIGVMPNMRELREETSAYCISDAETDRIIRQFYDEFHQVGLLHSTLEPHGAVAWGAAKKYRWETGYNGKIITLETAHPGKFPERIEKIGIRGVVLPKCLARLVDKPHGRYYHVENDYSSAKELIKALYTQELRRAA